MHSFDHVVMPADVKNRVLELALKLHLRSVHARVLCKNAILRHFVVLIVVVLI